MNKGNTHRAFATLAAFALAACLSSGPTPAGGVAEQAETPEQKIARLESEVAALAAAVGALQERVAALEAVIVGGGDQLPLPEEAVARPATPHVGDETSLAVVFADPAAQSSKPAFVVCGRMEISNYYNYGYSDQQRNFYSTKLTELKAAEGKSGRTISVFVPRREGAQLVEWLTANEGQPVRVKLRITDRAFSGRDWGQMAEVVDWQLLGDDGKTWGEWIVATEAERVREEGNRRRIEMLEKEEAEAKAKAAKKKAKKKTTKKKKKARGADSDD